MDAGSSEWHGEAMLDKGIRTRHGGSPLMLSRQNPCGKPATSPLLSAFCRAFGLRTRILTESPPPRPPGPPAFSRCSITTYLGTVSQWSTCPSNDEILEDTVC